MGQKVNPHGIRLGINKTWSSRWFSKTEYTQLLHQDLKIKEYVEDKLKNAFIKEKTTKNNKTKQLKTHTKARCINKKRLSTV